MKLSSSALRCALLALVAPYALVAGVDVFISVGPPPLPVYEQPMCPQDGYSWTPGYWAWGGDEGYFWVPGTWVLVPAIGMLWTPGYWGGQGDGFIFHSGYWGTHVGFYGGVNYGYGYGGSGFEGGYWRGRNYYYNRNVANLGNTHITNVYNKTVIVHNTTNVSYNGGRGGLSAAPSHQEQRALSEHHLPPTQEQAQHHQGASQNKELLASVNHGKPAVAATARAGDFSPRSAMPAKAAGRSEEHAPGKAMPAAAEHHAPGQAQHAQTPQRQAPTQHEPAQHQAPMQHEPAQRQAPMQHEPAQRQAPMQREPAARPAPAPRAMPESRPAPRQAPAARPAPAPRPPQERAAPAHEHGKEERH